MRQSPEEKVIWTKMASGDERSLGELMRIYYKTLFGYGARFVKNDDLLKDCIQELFIDIWKQRETLVVPDSIRAYLMVSLKRRIGRNISREPCSEELTDNLSLAMEFSPEWWVIEDETLSLRIKEVAELLNTLPKRQREVIYLKFYEGMGREEIAAFLSITPQTVSNLLQLAYTHIRKHWKISILCLLLVINYFLI